MLDYGQVFGIIDRIWDKTERLMRQAAVSSVRPETVALIEGTGRVTISILKMELWALAVEAEANGKDVENDAVIIRRLPDYAGDTTGCGDSRMDG